MEHHVAHERYDDAGERLAHFLQFGNLIKEVSAPSFALTQAARLPSFGGSRTFGYKPGKGPLMGSNQETLARYSGILRTAAKPKGMHNLGLGTRAEATELGRAWVGPGYRVSRNNPNVWISKDGLRQFRLPSYKGTRPPRHKGVWREYQVNFEWRHVPKGSFPNNGHLHLID